MDAGREWGGGGGCWRVFYAAKRFRSVAVLYRVLRGSYVATAECLLLAPTVVIKYQLANWNICI